MRNELNAVAQVGNAPVALSATHQPDALITQSETESIAGISKSTIWRKIAKNEFPRPAKLSSRCTRWSQREVLQWVSNRLAERDTEKAA